jgi:deazaflavin-dependent oxidoreductase (nitroreductase family)
MSVKVPPRGTRGIPFPRFLTGFAARMMVRQFRRNHGARTQGGLHALMLETVGARTGEVRRAVLGYLEEPGESWLVIASAVGAARNPGWLHNLAANPRATIEFGDGRRLRVMAETLHGEELDRAWMRIAVDAPEYVGYRTKTDREIGVVRLRPDLT